MDEQLTCPHCKSTNVYFRIKTQTYTCRRCGESWAKVVKAAKKILGV